MILVEKIFIIPEIKVGPDFFAKKDWRLDSFMEHENNLLPEIICSLGF